MIQQNRKKALCTTVLMSGNFFGQKYTAPLYKHVCTGMKRTSDLSV